MENDQEKQNLIHDLDANNKNKFTLVHFFLFLSLIIVAGFIAGFILTTVQKSSTSTKKALDSPAKKTAGISDKKTFKDKAEGVLKEGGANGEGNFHLERAGGESQNVYLTSTTVDLFQYIDKKVRVWGETFSAQKAGWLMDVGLVELLQ